MKKIIITLACALLAACSGLPSSSLTGANRTPDESRAEALPPLQAPSRTWPLPQPQQSKPVPSRAQVAADAAKVLGLNPALAAAPEASMADEDPAPEPSLLERWFGVRARR